LYLGFVLVLMLPIDFLFVCEARDGVSHGRKSLPYHRKADNAAKIRDDCDYNDIVREEERQENANDGDGIVA
jgi:hypothetical protein